MTTQEDVLLREVDEELNQDKQLAALKRYGPWAAGVGIAFLVAIGAAQYLEARDAAARAEAAVTYDTALEAEAGAARLLDIAPDLEGGYDTLARLRGAGLLARSGQPAEAAAAYGAVIADEAVPLPLKDLARVKAGYLALETDPAEAASIAAGIESPAFLPFAQEITGLAAMAQESFAAAESAFRTAASDPAAPAELAARTSSLASLAAAGRSGVTLAAPEGSGMATSDILELFGNMEGAATPDADAAETEADTPPAEDTPAEEGAPEGMAGDGEAAAAGMAGQAEGVQERPEDTPQN